MLKLHKYSITGRTSVHLLTSFSLTSILNLYTTNFCFSVTSSQFGSCKFFKSILMCCLLSSNFKTDSILIFCSALKHLQYQDIILIPTKSLVQTLPQSDQFEICLVVCMILSILLGNTWSVLEMHRLYDAKQWRFPLFICHFFQICWSNIPTVTDILAEK